MTGTELSLETSTQPHSANNQVNVLGIHWDTELDELKFSVCDFLDVQAGGQQQNV